MKKIIAYETPDKTRFFDENEARTHERRCDFTNLIDTAVRSNPQFARLDKSLLIDLFMQHGSTIGKLADSPIAPEELRSPPAGFSGTLRDKQRTGILPHPSSPEGQRRAGAVANEVKASYVEPTKDTTGNDSLGEDLQAALERELKA